jgi:hypothetical protein
MDLRGGERAHLREGPLAVALQHRVAAQPERETVEAGLEGEAAPVDPRGQRQNRRLHLRAQGAERVRAVRNTTRGRVSVPTPYARALPLRASYSAWLMAPLSSSCLALSISAAGPPLPATDLT